MKTYLVFGAFLGAALALLGPLATEGRGDFMLYGSETLTVNTNHNNGYLWDTSRASIVSGGSVADTLRAYNSSTADISGGSVFMLQPYDTSTVKISGGSVPNLQAYNSSTVDISDGSVANVQAYDICTVDISDGSVDVLFAYHTSAVDISGGLVTTLYARGSSTSDISGGSVPTLYARDSSTVDISGGSVPTLYANQTSTVTFHGRQFHAASGLTIDGDRVLGTGFLSGEWMDGTRWGMSIESHDVGAQILIIPEPATLGLLAAGLGALVARKRKV